MEKMRLLPEFTKGIVKENPVLRLALGTCPALAVTTSAMNGVGMGLATTLVLLFSNIIISLMRKRIPNRVRIPAYITTIAGLVSIVQMIVRAYAPALDSALGIFLPLIAVNCIIFARAEVFAAKNKVLPSAVDALGMGIGFTAALLLMGGLREIFGAGTLFYIPLTYGIIDPAVIMILPPGGFFVFGVLVALSNRLDKRPMAERPTGCSGCPSRRVCANADCKDGGDA